jgi:hypothetical protein
VADSNTSGTDTPRTEERSAAPRRIVFWKRVIRALQVALVLSVAFAVWFIAFGRGSSGPAPVLPDTNAQFSLDLKVVGKMDHDVVYAVEQRARPAYRIFSFDPATGVDETVFTVPKDAIIYGIALSPDRTTLAVSYSPDFHVKGSGLWTLDVASKKFTEVAPTEEGHYLVDPAWSGDATSIYATYVDRTGADEKLSTAQVTLADLSLRVIIADGIAPTVSGDTLYYLTVDEQRARRSIAVLTSDDGTSTIPVGDGQFDLDHLLVGASGSVLHVAVLEPKKDEASVTIGTPAEAHGNHDVPSTWWDVDVKVAAPTAAATDLASTIVYDAANSGDSIVSATREGLSITSGSTRTDLIASRAIRFVAG